MKIRSLIRKGSDHKVFCQDFMSVYEGQKFIIAGVFDGCSTAYDKHENPISQFASNLLAKVLDYCSINYGNLMLLSSEEFISCYLAQFFKKLKNIKKELMLEDDSLLSTAIILFYNKENKSGYIYAFGDGVIQLDDELIVIDQNNFPKYPILYIDELISSSLQLNFPDELVKIIYFENVNNVVISTDGVLTFRNSKEELDNNIPKDTLFQNTQMADLTKMLARHYNILKNKNWEHLDDLGMIRFIIDE